MRQRDSRVCRNCQSRADSRHNFERNSGVIKRFRLFATTTEEKWISAFEAHHSPSAVCRFDQQSIDFCLGCAATAANLPHWNALCAEWREVENLRINQIIVENQIA